MRVLDYVRVASFDPNVFLDQLGTIEITSAAPDYAEALYQDVRAKGGNARIVEAPQGAEICVLTEGLTADRPAKRHHEVLKAIFSVGAGARTIILDHASAERFSDIGGTPGLCRSIRIEQPDFEISSLSLSLSETGVQHASLVSQALNLVSGDYILRDDGIWQDVPGKEIKPVDQTDAVIGSPVWLITGGGRGVTADCAVELAKRTKGQFILLGRSDVVSWPEWLESETDLKTLRGMLAKNTGRPGVPQKLPEIDRLARKLLASAEIASTLDAIAAAGGNATYVPSDIGDRSSLKKILENLSEQFGTVTGLVHGAGILSDGLATSLTLTSFETVFTPKVLGLETILSCLDLNALKHIGLFSSASAVFGNQGQANYAAANAWLNNVAVQLAETLPHAQVKSFCWGPWQGGMVDETLARMFTERGIGLITKSEGARIFADQLLHSSHNQVRFVIGDEWGNP